MARWRLACLVVALFWAFTIFPQAGRGEVAGMSKGPTAAPRPAEITGVVPLPGGRTCRTPEIAVDLRLTNALRKAGAFDPSRVRLTLDEVDVTRNARVRGTMDYPQSRALLVYVPKKPLAIGPHRVAVTLASGVGSRTYAWAFTAVEGPCP